MPKHHQMIILGSGPAGSTAAIYAARADLKPVVFEGIQPGGQLTITTEVENFPGYVDGIMGPELVDIFKRQAERFGAEYLTEEIIEADLSQRPFKLKSYTDDYTCDALIIATGASARWLGIPSEQKYMGHGVSACATCDGFFFKDKPIAVVGGGDSAMEEAVFLTKFASKVTIIHRRDELRASKIMQEKAKENPKIEFALSCVIDEVIGADDPPHVTAAKLKNVKDGSEFDLPVDGIFMGIGHIPNSKVFGGQLDMDNNGYIITRGKSTSTSVPGVFACGDVQDSVYRQAISAAGSGCMAAIDAERFLEG
ncbi:thioredoxin-disulfide reductase [candidate division LCP-89 bacterium B3_LCP]|uniref:Thioredoxin reductase n=1 Tax=candidate division LCP-89 bacterium B3_LCP TaxID=2012998 RepID=A0A532V0I0_UNCL8|nr:MAG: thioredoxin-disulfide reductase [candidate division LCP-89 bacterium B3_LCP]